MPHFKKLCKHCNKGYNNEDHKCTNKREKGYACTECEKKYFSSKKLGFHVKRVHTKEKNHLCKPCGKYFADDELLRNHSYQSHKKVTCPQCNKLILNRTILNKHLALEHGLLDGAFICDICPNYCVFSKKSYDVHMNKKHLVETRVP